MGRDVESDEQPVDPEALWVRLRWAGCWPAAKQWPQGSWVALANERYRLEDLDLPAEERIAELVRWLEERTDPADVAQGLAQERAAVRRRGMPTPVHRLRAVLPEDG
jgi:hypothetical protein